MFTGIVEAIGTVWKTETEGHNLHLWVKSDLSSELKIDQSIAHNGVCLTVTEIKGDTYKVTAIQETLQRTNIGLLKAGGTVNLERCLLANSRLDGHIVQGHVDTTAELVDLTEADGSWVFRFRFNDKNAGKNLVVEKGSICINGVSLTVVEADNDQCSVAIIPYTFDHTNFRDLKRGDTVNIEFDVIGKYVQTWMENRNS